MIRVRYKGAREFSITFKEAIDPAINEKSGFGIENLTWTPEVLFAGNTIRNNRARGTHYSVLLKRQWWRTICLTILPVRLYCCVAIAMAGSRQVLAVMSPFVAIVFINALTNMFQFTNAVISIYPEIPNLKDQQKSTSMVVRWRYRD